MAGGQAATGPDALFEGYVFDLDGTIYLGEELLPGAGRLLARLRELGRRMVFVSNNPTRDPEMYADKLRRLGVEASVLEVLNTVVTMTRWLSRHHPDATVFPIAEEPLCRALAAAPPTDRPTWVLERVDRLLPPSAWPVSRDGRLPP